MSLRKIVGLLAGFALAVGLIGVGVSASFTDSVTAKENINVGTFSCGITTATDGATYGAVDGLGYAHSVSYTAPTIESSAPGSAPFSFTVKNTGSIPDVLTVATSAVTTPPWSIIGAPFAPVPLAAGDSHPYNTGVSWTTLDNSQLNAHGSVTWTVSCGEVQAPTVTITSPAMNFGPNGWAGWSCPANETVISAAVTGASYTSLTLWKLGAPVTGGATYPNTPFGYTYATGEEGAIVQSTNAGGTDTIVLQCQP
jgi:predicted ribosomally synthesized peptide with SipW-like signal peptide